MPEKPLDGRLAAVASFVRPGARFADIGTDHAYLPIALIRAGTVSEAIATDLSDGPLSRARKNIRKNGMEERIRTVKTDGLNGLENLGITDIAVCGMGGETIAEILCRAKWIRTPDIRLILQPMTMQEKLRRFLSEEGFQIEEETIGRSNGRLFPVFRCRYAGEPDSLSEEDAYFGRSLLAQAGTLPLFGAYLEEKCASLEKILDGKRSAGLDTSREERLLSAVRPLRTELPADTNETERTSTTHD